jgi:DNA-binding NtrC family response regulator
MLQGDVFEAGRRARELLAVVLPGADPLAHVIALSAHARVLLTTGDLTIAGDAIARLRQAARTARTPLRLARLRLLLADAYRRSGRTHELARELAWLGRIRAAAAPLLRNAIDRRLRGDGDTRTAISLVSPSLTTLPASVPAATLVAIGREEEDDRAAVTRLLEASGAAIRSTRVDLHSADGGPVSVILSTGMGQPTTLGTRVLESGIAIGPEAADRGHELAVPVRLGMTLLASLGARWPADRPPPGQAQTVLELTAAVAAPRIEALLAVGREDAAAAIAVPELIGGSAGMGEVRKAVARAAAAPFAVLIEGESGVGKELVARAVHQLGPRRERRFCDVNCAALPDELLESELFGHARGAFTGAVTERRGLFEDADGGTIFLDEVADLSPRAQAKLLRVIQQQEVRRVGETFSRPIDVRMVAAANRDMRGEAAAGRFRQDLLYRLDVIRIAVPPLRDRPDDIAPLAAWFWRSASAKLASTAVLTHGVLSALASYQWPGNVRELQNVIAALAVAAPSRGAVRPHLLPAAIAGAAAPRMLRLGDARAEFERRFVEAALARAGGSRTRAARALGVSRQGLLKILTRVGVT